MSTKTTSLTDIEIAQKAHFKPIQEIAESLGLQETEWEPYGRHKAKVSLEALQTRKATKDGKVILVSSINPTPAGEGKSTVTVGLGQALNKLGKKAIVALREPSLGPTMGIKGGACGGGYSQVIPMEEINLHFTGDMHAITTANNALSSFIDNHIHQGNACNIDVRRITWKRAVDLNDRALRNVIVGLGGPIQGTPREDGFQITVASEIMAILCLATSLQDLKKRLSKIVIGYTAKKEPITVEDLDVQGALTLLLKDAIKPNLVQTLENTPALIHGGPFANIAHGCNSLLATKLACKLGDYVVTEAGFGVDLGAEKFLNIKARVGEIDPKVVVIVATVRALKMHGGKQKSDLLTEDIGALSKGMDNLQKHVETIQSFGLPFVIAVNRFTSDSPNELSFIKEWCKKNGYQIALSDVWEKGGEGGKELAQAVLNILEHDHPTYRPLYSLDQSLEDKITCIAQKVYGAQKVSFAKKALKQLEEFTANGWGTLPVCMAKTQYSLTDDPTVTGRPRAFTLTIKELRPSIGAGFIVALTGDVMTMPGLPKEPSALKMDVNQNGEAVGLF